MNRKRHPLLVALPYAGMLVALVVIAYGYLGLQAVLI